MKLCTTNYDGFFYNWKQEALWFHVNEDTHELLVKRNGVDQLIGILDDKPYFDTMVKKFGEVALSFGVPWKHFINSISYEIIENDIIHIISTNTMQEFFYDNQMPLTYRQYRVPFDDLDKQYEYLFYTNNGSKRSFFLKEIFKNSGVDTILDVLSEMDHSENHAVRLGCNSLDEEYAVLNRFSFEKTNYQVLGVNVFELLGATEYAKKNRIADWNGVQLSVQCKGKYIEELNYLKDYYHLSDAELFWFLKCKFLDNVERPETTNRIKHVYLDEIELWIDSILNDFGYYTEHPHKWKNEFHLYEYIKSFCPEAVFQAKPKWLAPQSFDVFIENKNTAIEYQGIQHFQPIDFFGDEEGYIETQKRDQKKKKKCEEHGIRILYWNYSEEVTLLSVERFLKNNALI